MVVYENTNLNLVADIQFRKHQYSIFQNNYYKYDIHFLELQLCFHFFLLDALQPFRLHKKIIKNIQDTVKASNDLFILYCIKNVILN